MSIKIFNPIGKGGTGSQSVQTQGFLNSISLLGNTTGATSAGTGSIILAGGNNITLSASTAAGGMSVTISGPNAGGAQTGISSVVASNTTYTSGQISFAGSDMITVKSGAGQAIIIDATQSVQTQAIQTGISSIVGSDATYTSGQVVFSGSHMITVGSAAGQKVIIDATQSVQTQAVQTGISSVSVSDTVYTSGQIVVIGSHMITAKSGANQSIILDATQSVQTQGFLNSVSVGGNTTGNTSAGTGSVIFAGGNNITLSGSTAAGGMTLTVSAFNQSVQPAQTGISSIAASNTTYTSGQVLFTGSHMITVGSDTGQHVVIDATQSVQTQGFVNSISVGSNTAGATSAGTGSLVLAGGNNITLSGSTAAGGMTLTISGANVGGAQTGISSIVASNTTYTSGQVLFTGSHMITVGSDTGQHVVIDATQSVQTQGFLNSISVIGNTAGTVTAGTGSLILSGGNNITLSGNTAAGGMTVNVSAFTQTVQTQGFLNSISIIGNTAGTVTAGTGSVVLSGGNNITLSGNTAAGGMTVNISAFTQTLQTSNVIDFSIAGGAGPGNTSGTLTLVSSGTLSMAASNNITLSQAGNAITISGPTLATMSSWAPFQFGSHLAQTFGQSSFWVFPMQCLHWGSFSTAYQAITGNISTSSNSSAAATISLAIGIYTRNVSTLSLATSGSTNYQFTVTGTSSSASYQGHRFASVPLTANMTPGEYWVGLLSQTASGNTNWMSFGNAVFMLNTAVAYAFNGQFGSSTAASAQFYPGLGIFSVQTNALPTAFGFSDLQGTNRSAINMPQFFFANYTA